MEQSEDQPHQATIHGDPVKHSGATVQVIRPQSESTTTRQRREPFLALLRPIFLGDEQLPQFVAFTLGQTFSPF